MPDAPDRWVALVREHSAAAGYTLSQAVVAELAEYVQDVHADARERGRSEEEALDAVRQVLARADYSDLFACRRATAPPPRDRPSALPARGSSLSGIDVDVRDAWRRMLTVNTNGATLCCRSTGGTRWPLTKCPTARSI